MNKIQKFPRTIGTVVLVKDHVEGISTDTVELDTALENLAGGMLTPDEKAYLQSKIGDQKKAYLQTLFNVTDSVGTLSFYEDTTPSADMTADRVVTIKFNGSNVDPTAKGDLTTYTNSATGVYARSEATTNPITPIDKAKAASFSFKVPAGTYGNYTVGSSETINVTGSIAEKAISIKKTAFWGFLDSNTVGSDISTQVAALNTAGGRTEGFSNQSKTQGGANDKYLWLVTKGTVAVTSMNLPVPLTSYTGKGFTSPKNENISLSDYKVYVSSEPVSPGTKVVITITV